MSTMDAQELHLSSMIDETIRQLWQKKFVRHVLELIEIPQPNIVRLSYNDAVTGKYLHAIPTKLTPQQILDDLASNNAKLLKNHTCTSDLKCFMIMKGFMQIQLVLGICEHGNIYMYRSDEQEVLPH